MNSDIPNVQIMTSKDSTSLYIVGYHVITDHKIILNEIDLANVENLVWAAYNQGKKDGQR